MTPSIAASLDPSATRANGVETKTPASDVDKSGIKQRFEQMLWAEMLSYAGLEKALTQGGGEAASSFSRYVVEAIAKDLAEKHPMGLGDHIKDLPGASKPEPEA